MTWRFFWVGWNTFLAVLPVAAAYAIYALARSGQKQPALLRRSLLLALGAVWLAFLPNTCYLLTEWRHFLDTVYSTGLYVHWHVGRDHDAILWLTAYALFFAGYSGVGMLCFGLAIRPIHRLLRERGVNVIAPAVPFFLLISLGVYLGLVLRFNSWQLATHPGPIWEAAVSALSRPALAVLIAAFAAVLWAAYLAVDIWIDGLLARLQRTGQ